MDNEIVVGDRPDGHSFGFLSLSNRSRLPGKLPFLPDRKKRVVPSFRKRFFSWVSRKPLDEFDGEEHKCSVYRKYIEWFLVAAITVITISTISIRFLRGKRFFGISLWKLEVFSLMLIGSRLVSAVLIGLIVCLLDTIFRYCDGFIYVVYKVRSIVKWSLFAWMVVAAWEFIYGELEGILEKHVLTWIEKFLINSAFVLLLCVVKSFFVMSVAAWFYTGTFREKVAESLFYRYVVENLVGLPFLEYRRRRRYWTIKTCEILTDRLKLNPVHMSSWHMKQMMMKKEEGIARTITTEDEAKRLAEKIFQNLAKPSSRFIELEDLNRFLPRSEALKTLNIFRTTFEEDENIHISLVTLQEWMVFSFKRDRNLLLMLRDMDDASMRIGIILNTIFGILLAAIAIPLMDWGGVTYLSFISTSSFVLTFLYAQNWKDHYSALQLLYIRRPFAVGDEVEVEGKELRVEKMNLLSTDFRGRDGKKYTFSNAGISEKLVANISRSELPAWSTADSLV